MFGEVTRGFAPTAEHKSTRSTVLQFPSVTNGPWPAIISLQGIDPNLWMRAFYFTWNIRVGSVNGFEYAVTAKLNGMPQLKFTVAAYDTNGTVTIPDYTSLQVGPFGNSVNGLENIKVTADGGNPQWLQPLTFICSMDEIEMNLTRQLGADSTQRPSWRLDVISRALDKGRSLPGLTCKV